MLIRNAELHFGARVDVRIANGCIAAIAARLAAGDSEPTLDAGGAALLPAVRDHHLHLRALAAAQSSIVCGPPQIADADALAARLRAAAADGNGWLRGIGFHESVCADFDRRWLDRHVATRPLRVQHRSGRLWVFNSVALAALGITDGGDDPFERVGGRLSGRLYDADDWLRARLPKSPQSLAALSRQLASRGVVGLTDTTHTNGLDAFDAFVAAHARGECLQALMVMGNGELDVVADQPGVFRGAHKFHLHEHELPAFDTLCAAIERSHVHGRTAAFHCVTRTELVYALSALESVGVRAGDRIEHAAVAPPELATMMARLGVIAVTQPNFIAERGDAYLRDVDAGDLPWLYRLRGLRAAGIPVVGSTDAPFGTADVWASMQAAVERRTPSGATLGDDERLTPEHAFSIYTGALQAPHQPVTALEVGSAADLCLLDRPWSRARSALGDVQVQMTWRAGHVIWHAAASAPVFNSAVQCKNSWAGRSCADPSQPP
ncbi:amidohydrolase family protein [Solimonas marina]|uniref:Amidohydrolase family protein n=1 Tax=Solimonas marina TaxID=2714601 RepID=A0A969W7B4_9GAMM|nr:amidohydrolase family protein [Solimonas marina]NKF22016.1 amidohydrolase family protein [Solimonas marina]